MTFKTAALLTLLMTVGPAAFAQTPPAPGKPSAEDRPRPTEEPAGAQASQDKTAQEKADIKALEDQVAGMSGKFRAELSNLGDQIKALQDRWSKEGSELRKKAEPVAQAESRKVKGDLQSLWDRYATERKAINDAFDRLMKDLNQTAGKAGAGSKPGTGGSPAPAQSGQNAPAPSGEQPAK